MKLLFLDESGDHNLSLIDKDYPLFVLAGCILDESYHKEVLTAKFNNFKTDIFKTDSITLHYSDYVRNTKGFERMADKAFREKFYEGLNNILKNTEFILLACIIDKIKHKDRYNLLAIDPYILSLEILVERFTMFLKDNDEKGVIIAESRGQQLDNELELAFLNLKINGTRYLKPKDITERIENFLIKKKKDNIAGLQLADTVSTPIGRRYLNKINYYLNYNIIKSKFRRIKCGRYSGYGLIIMPLDNKKG